MAIEAKRPPEMELFMASTRKNDTEIPVFSLLGGGPAAMRIYADAIADAAADLEIPQLLEDEAPEAARKRAFRGIKHLEGMCAAARRVLGEEATAGRDPIMSGRAVRTASGAGTARVERWMNAPGMINLTDKESHEAVAEEYVLPIGIIKECAKDATPFSEDDYIAHLAKEQEAEAAAEAWRRKMERDE